jgi:hypothetical protein
VHTDDALRTFIVLSGIWVAFCENWSPAYSWSKALATPNSASTNSRPIPNRAVSMSFIDSPRSVSPASTVDENRRTIPKLFRTGTQRLQSSTSFTNSVSSPTHTTRTSPPVSPRAKTRSRRSNSTGNADLIKRSNSHRKRFGLAFEDQSLPETEEERQTKRSNEILRIKEMSLPSPPPSSDPPVPAPTPLVVEPPAETSPSSPPSPVARERKTQSAYNPVTTAGLWDSGVTDKPGLKSRPTSLVVVNSKKDKAKRKQERSKSKENGKGKEKDVPRKAGGLRRFLSIFRREKTYAA